MSDRRDFFKKIGLIGISGIATKLVSNEQLNALETLGNESTSSLAFTLPALPYAYNALEPFIDEQTMTIHHTKHHQGYVNNCNEIRSTDMDYQVDDITKCHQFDPLSKGKSALRNNLGGHVNHSLFWTLLKPNPERKANLPLEKLHASIEKTFGSFDDFKKQFGEKASKHFGSGWCWLVLRNDKLIIEATENQENPFMRTSMVDNDKIKVILALDVWEHAYYLKYQNKRTDYISNWWNVVNWEKAEELFSAK